MSERKLRRFNIISCSRRTDIPAFLMDWVLEQIRQGYVDVTNPFNAKQITRVSLSPKDVKCWCWWSKDFGKWIQYYKSNKELFQAYKGHYFQFTINSPSELERNLDTPLSERLNQLEWLVKEFGTLAVNYRYDPIVFYKKKDSNQVLNNLGKFKYLIEKIANFGLQEVIFSFATIYSKVKRRMNARGYIPIDPSLQKKKDILKKLLSVCEVYGVSLKACCQPDLLNLNGIEQAHCVDARKISQLIGDPLPVKRDTGQRDACGCHKSKDIGGYHGIFKCKHDCTYCYANPAKK